MGTTAVLEDLRCLTVQQFADLVGVDTSLVYRLIKTGELRAIRLPTARRKKSGYRIPVNEARRFAEVNMNSSELPA